jgi:hypothetical protein
MTPFYVDKPISFPAGKPPGYAQGFDQNQVDRNLSGDLIKLLIIFFDLVQFIFLVNPKI